MAHSWEVGSVGLFLGLSMLCYGWYLLFAVLIGRSDNKRNVFLGTPLFIVGFCLAVLSFQPILDASTH